MIKICAVVCTLLIVHVLEARNVASRVCVIGAGIGGLNSARFLKDEGIDFTVLEATNHVGGTWRYEEKTGTDEYGQPIYTSMYKHLRTNLPKVTMEFRDFPMPADAPQYPGGDIYYKYLKSYADHFDLMKHIKFLHRAESVKRVENIWKVKYVHVPSGKVYEEDFDYMIVANGHYSTPHLPNIAGEKLFKGTLIHSHDYRDPEPYKSRRVLIVGAGPSGLDISLDIATVSKTLVHSHHSKNNNRTPFPLNYIRKPDIKEFNETGVIFQDGSYEEIDDVIYCTGFEYNYPFLDESSGLSLTPHSVTPLYNYLVNINQPTMVVIGLVVRACLAKVIEVQAQYATALIMGNFTLPSHEEMMQEWQSRYDVVKTKGLPMSGIHLLDEREDKYYAELSREAGIFRVPPVMAKIRKTDSKAKAENLYTYRNYAYKVIDDENFIREKIEGIPEVSTSGAS